MKLFLVPTLILLLCLGAAAQSDLQPMLDAEKAFQHEIADKGVKTAFLDALASDSIIFHPEAVNGRDYWSKQPDSSAQTLVRVPTYGDISSNGVLGYTMGNWRLYQKGKSEALAEFGQYVTIWEKPGTGSTPALTLALLTKNCRFP